MSESIADRAVAALAAVSRMRDGISIDHPERAAVREIHQVALSVLDEAFRQALRLAYAAEGLQETMRKEESERAAAAGKGAAS